MRIRFPYGSLLLLSILTLAVGAAHAASAKAPLLFIAAPSNSNATTHVEQVMRQTKLALEAQGYRGEILLSSAERPRFLRLVTQKQLRQSDVDLLHKPEVALRVCQAMSCRLGMLVDVTPTEVMPTREATALTVNLTLVYPDTEKLDNLEGITAQQTEFIPNPKKPKRKEIKTAYQVAGERIAQVLSERVSKLPSGDQPRQSLADAHIAKSKEHLTRNQLAEALDEAYQAMALAPNNPEPYALAGDVFVAQEDWEGARVQYERALHSRLPL